MMGRVDRLEKLKTCSVISTRDVKRLSLLYIRAKHAFVVLLVVVQFPSHVQLCHPTDCCSPGFPVPHHLPEFARVHVHCIGAAILRRYF